MSQPANEPSEPAPTQRWTIPSPTELALIAAILKPGCDNDSEKAVEEAIQLFMHAALTHGKYAPYNFQDILMKLEMPDGALVQRWLALGSTPKKLRLYPDKAVVDAETKKQFFDGDLDPVRSYLHKESKSLNLSTTRTVLKTIELYFLEWAHRHNSENKEKIEALEKQHAKMAKERNVTIDMLRNGMMIMDDHRRADGNKNYEGFMNHAAVRAEGTSEVPMDEHGSKRTFRRGKVIYWELTEFFLADLIKFRVGVKKMSGGIQGLMAQINRAAKKVLPAKKVRQKNKS